MAQSRIGTDVNRRRHIRLLPIAAAAVAVAVIVAPVSAQNLQFFRIGTGSISGVYFPVGGLIASAISHPPGASLCGQGGSCGVPGLVAVAQASRGSVINVQGIASGRIESALVQADVAYSAYHGKDHFAGKNAVPGLRVIANLYPEAVHVVVREDSRIRSVADLRGKRVSLDLEGSGTRPIAVLVLKGYGVERGGLRQVNSQVGPAIDRLRGGRIDGFFFVGGFPAPSIARLAGDMRLRLLPVAGEAAAAITARDPFLAAARIPERTYAGIGAVETLAVGALWLVSDKIGEDLVYGITRALWHPSTREILDQGPPPTREMQLSNALDGVEIPLHPGAARFYRQMGMLEESAPAAEPTSTTEPDAAPKGSPESTTSPVN